MGTLLMPVLRLIMDSDTFIDTTLFNLHEKIQPFVFFVTFLEK